MLLYFSEKYFYKNVANVSLNVTKHGMLIANVEINKSHDFGCYGNHFSRKL